WLARNLLAQHIPFPSTHKPNPAWDRLQPRLASAIRISAGIGDSRSAVRASKSKRQSNNSRARLWAGRGRTARASPPHKAGDLGRIFPFCLEKDREWDRLVA